MVRPGRIGLSSATPLWAVDGEGPLAVRTSVEKSGSMPTSTDIRIKDASCAFEPITFRSPLKFGGRVQSKTHLITVEVAVETRDGKHRATGFGSMPMGNVWAWPSEQVAPEQTESAMRTFAEEIVDLAGECTELGHPVDLAYHLSAEYDHLGKTISRRLKLAEPIPELAQLTAASAFDAALHDAYGRVHELSSFNVLTSKYMHHDLAEYLDETFAGEYLDQYTTREPVARLPLYHLVGALDPLTAAEITKPLNDGLPEALGAWIKFNGLTHLKLKLDGANFDWDLARVLAIDAVATETQSARGVSQWFYSLDFNERCSSIEYVVDLLKKLQEQNPQAFERIQYVEQPMHRNLRAHPDQKVHAAAAIKPIVIDESLVSYDSMLAARELGYTGVALKACKGQTESLLMAAAAQKFGMFLCVQDLTCPGAAFLHSASLAARIPGIAAVEGNARQYCPSANKIWSKQYPGLFDFKDGQINTSLLDGPGLGF